MKSPRPAIRPEGSKPGLLFRLVALLSVALVLLPGCGWLRSGDRAADSGRDPRVITEVPPEAVFYLNDHLGSPVVITDAQGRVVRETTYHPYGAERWSSGDDDPFAYVGNERDEGSGLGDFGARPYASEAGIFLAPDPVAVFEVEKTLAEPGRLLAYGYSGGDPQNRVDRDGEFWGAIIAGASAAIAVLVTPQYANAPTRTNAITKHKPMAQMAIEATATAIELYGIGMGVEAAATVSVRVASHAVQRYAGRKALQRGETEIVQRVMSRAELKATERSKLLRGGREGEHYVTTHASRDAKRAQKRLALKQEPEVRVTLEVPKGRLSEPTTVGPKYGQPGGGVQRVGTGHIPVRVLRQEPMK